MVKEPRAGRVKTRLGVDIGMTGSAWWYRHQTARLLRHISDPRWHVVLSVAPDRAIRSPVWPALPRYAQGKGDIGVRMRRSLKATPGPTVLIGSDIPGVTRAHVSSAFRKLGRHETVIGPAQDGGFWLIGSKHPKRLNQSLFKGVLWSNAKTLSQTLPTLPHPVGYVETLRDVDTANDLA